MSESTFYITTPIYYVNDKPHIGHAYTTILADVLARYHRLLGKKVFFLTGTDEHGQKVQQAAKNAGISAQQQVENTVGRFKELWKKLNISHDDFIRTTEERHTAVVQKILQDLYDRNEIYKAEYSGWYCVSEERFYTEKDLVDGKSPDTGAAVEYITETNYFFRMGKYKEWLIEYIETHPECIQPDFRRNETLGFLQHNALNDLCISRPKDRLRWGIELPFDKAYVTYVWFDALVNYISAIGHLSDEQCFQSWWPATHLIGKDILTTHTVYWPTMLKALNLPMPRTIFAHGWWLSGNEKMSKSLGNVVNPMDYAEQYGVDAFRYFLIAEMTMGQDASFTHDSFVRRYNAELANDLGNLVSRVLKMFQQNLNGMMPVVPEQELGEDERKLWQKAQNSVNHVSKHLKTMRLDLGLAEVIQTIRETNRYLEIRQPWKQAKDENKRPLEITLYTAAEVLRVVSALLHPVMPEKMDALRQAFNLPETAPDNQWLTSWGKLNAGMQTKPVVLFPRIQTEKNKKKTMEGVQDCIEITSKDFEKIELRTAKIYKAEKIKNTEKLLRLDVFVGEERRQIVAGIALQYEPDDLIGKTVVIVANLKPVKIRGVESNGMLLAAKAGERMRLVTVDGELVSGAKIS